MAKESSGLFLRRTGAFIVDIICSWAFLVRPFAGLIEKSVSTKGFAATVAFLSEHPQTVFSLNIISLFVSFMVISYFVLLQYVTGQTIGMLAFSLRVVPLNHRLHWWQCITRNLFLIPFFPFIFLMVTEIATLAWSKGEVRFLERISQTRTIIEPHPELKEHVTKKALRSLSWPSKHI